MQCLKIKFSTNFFFFFYWYLTSLLLYNYSFSEHTIIKLQLNAQLKNNKVPTLSGLTVKPGRMLVKHGTNLSV